MHECAANLRIAVDETHLARSGGLAGDDLAAAGALFGFVCYPSDSPAYLMLFDALTAPADGAVTPKWVLPMVAANGFALAFNAPMTFSTGIVAVFSSTGPFTKTASAAAFISGQAQ